MSGASWYSLNQRVNSLQGQINQIPIPPEPPFDQYALLSGTQSFTGINTFTQLPESSVIPTTDPQLANKKYVDDEIVLSTSQWATYPAVQNVDAQFGLTISDENKLTIKDATNNELEIYSEPLKSWIKTDKELDIQVENLNISTFTISFNFGTSTWTQNANLTPLILGDLQYGNINNCISSTGQYQMVGISRFTGALYQSSDYGVTWSQHLPLGTENIQSVAISGSGQYRVCASLSSNFFYQSSDYGVTYTTIDTSNYTTWGSVSGFTSFTISPDGQYWFSCGSQQFNGVPVAVSSDFGVTWTNNGIITSGDLSKIIYSGACSFDGQYQLFVGSNIWVSNDYGATFSTPLSPANYRSSCNVSHSGQYMIFQDPQSATYISTNYGVSWNTYANAYETNSEIKCIISDSTGQYVYMVTQTNTIPSALLYSIDYGVTWIPTPQPFSLANYRSGIGLSSDGIYANIVNDIGTFPLSYLYQTNGAGTITTIPLITTLLQDITIVADSTTITNTLVLNSSLKDSVNSTGLAGQVLTSNGTDTIWSSNALTVTDNNTASTFYPVFVSGVGSSIQAFIDSVTSPLSYISSTGILSSIGLSLGTAGLSSTTGRNTGFSTGSNWLYISATTATAIAKNAITPIVFNGTVRGDTTQFSETLTTTGAFSPNTTGTFKISLNFSTTGQTVNIPTIQFAVYTAVTPTVVGGSLQLMYLDTQSVAPFQFSSSYHSIVTLTGGVSYTVSYLISPVFAGASGSQQSSVCISRLM